MEEADDYLKRPLIVEGVPIKYRCLFFGPDLEPLTGLDKQGNTLHTAFNCVLELEKQAFSVAKLNPMKGRRARRLALLVMEGYQDVQ